MTKRRLTIEWDDDSPQRYRKFANALWGLCEFALPGRFRVVHDEHTTAQELNNDYDATGRMVRWE